MENLQQIYNKINNLNNLLDRKITILTKILNITENQNIVFKEVHTTETDDFLNISLSEKQQLIDELINIDSMFLAIFESFSGDLNANKEIFKNDIIIIKEKIQKITDIDFKIRINEEKNKNIANKNVNFTNKTEKIKTFKVSKNDMLKKYSNNVRNDKN